MPFETALKTSKKSSKQKDEPIMGGFGSLGGFDPLDLTLKQQLKDSRKASGAVPPPPSVGGSGSGSGGPAGGGGGGGSGGSPASAPSPTESTWTIGFEVDGAPAWWQGLVPPNQSPQNRYLATLNSLIPFMSPEDQRRVATSLARQDDAFSAYTAEVIGTEFPTEIDSDLIRDFTSAERGSEILSTLETFSEASGLGDDAGPGFGFLQDFAKLLRDFGGEGEENRQSRTQAAQLRGQLEPLLSSADTPELGAFGDIARTLAFPFFSAGELTPVTRAQDGSFIMGRPNPKFFS